MKYIFIFLVLSFLIACKRFQKHSNGGNGNFSTAVINVTDPLLSFKNGFWYYAENLFSGTIIKLFQDNTIHQSTAYQQGKEHGWQHTFYHGGILSEKRYFNKGEKDGMHTGWWQNGNKRFEYHFANGIYNGDYKEWYESGQMLKHIHYRKGTDEWGKGWRESGKPYMNYVINNGRRYGIVNSNLCYTVRKGSGEYVKSVLPD